MKAREGEPWVEAVIALGLCGLRRGEIFGLTWGHVQTGRVLIRQTLKEVGAKRVLGPPKTKKARREVPLTPSARAAIARHRAALGVIPHPTALVFTTAEGTPVRFSNFARRQLAPLAKRAKVPGTTLHQLRHTSATLLLASGVDVKSVQAILGHKKATTTLDVYADFVRENVDAAMEKLGAML